MSAKSLTTMVARSLMALAAFALQTPLAAQEPQVIEGLKQPESIAIGPRGQIYVSETGEYEKPNDGYISIPGTLEKVAGGVGAADGLQRDSKGRLILTDYAGHRVFVLTKADAKPQEILVSGVESAADFTISPDGKSLLIPDMGGGKIAVLPMPR